MKGRDGLTVRLDVSKMKPPRLIWGARLMELEIEGNEQLTTVRVFGEAISCLSYSLQDAIVELSKTGRQRVRLDLGHIPWVDTGGVGMLLALRARLARLGGSIEIINPQPAVLETLRALHVTEVFGLG